MLQALKVWKMLDEDPLYSMAFREKKFLKMIMGHFKISNCYEKVNYFSICPLTFVQEKKTNISHNRIINGI